MNRFFVKTNTSERIGIMQTGEVTKGFFLGQGFGANIGVWPIPRKWPVSSLDEMTEVPALPDWVGKRTQKLS